MYYGASDIGLIRAENQDNFASITNQKGDMLHIVCDGIGGGLAGDKASLCSIKYLAEKFANTNGFKSIFEAKVWFETVITETNQYIVALSQKSKITKGMGTTLLAAFVSDKGSFIINIGDSRAFMLLENELEALTTDHNLANELFQQGKIKQSEVAYHPQRNILTNAIGINKELKIDIFDVDRKAQYILLSTDGLHDYVKTEAILNVLNKTETSLQEKVYQLIDLSNQAGGFDNVTIILIDLVKGGKEDVS